MVTHSEISLGARHLLAAGQSSADGGGDGVLAARARNVLGITGDGITGRLEGLLRLLLEAHRHDGGSGVRACQVVGGCCRRCSESASGRKALAKVKRGRDRIPEVQQRRLW